MKKLNIPTLVILGVSVFCISEKHIEMALVIQRYCTGVCALLFLLWFSLPLSLGARKYFPINAVLRTVCLIGALEVQNMPVLQHPDAVGKSVNEIAVV